MGKFDISVSALLGAKIGGSVLFLALPFRQILGAFSLLYPSTKMDILLSVLHIYRISQVGRI